MKERETKRDKETKRKEKERKRESKKERTERTERKEKVRKRERFLLQNTDNDKAIFVWLGTRLPSNELLSPSPPHPDRLQYTPRASGPDIAAR